MAKLEMTPEILEALQKLSSLLESEDAFDRTLHTVVELSVATLPGCDSAGVTVRDGGKDKTVVASDSFALQIDKIQYETGEGPCLATLDDREPTFIESVWDEARWPEFSRRAASDGLRGSASFPLGMNGTSAALNLYAKKTEAFDDKALAVAEVFARQASIALENAHIYQAARALGDQLNEALQTRDVIGQAKGILMEREGVSDQEAFEMLRTISQNSNVKLRDIAQRLIEEKANGG